MAVLQNYGGTFAGDIASVTRLATSAPFFNYLREEIFLRSAMIRSGIIQRSPQLESTTGVLIEAPFHSPIDPVEEIVDSGNTWGTSGAGYLTPQSQEASTQYATITHRGWAYAVDELTEMITGEDVMAALADYMLPAIDKLRVAKLIAHLEGLLGAAGPLNATHNLDVTANEVPGALTEDNWMTARNVIKARYLLGERQSNLVAAIIHSSVAAHLEEIGMLTFEPAGAIAAGAGVQFGRGGVGVGPRMAYMPMAGVNVVVDDQCPVIEPVDVGDALKYVCYLFAPGVVREGYQRPLRSRTGENILSEQRVMTVRYDHVQHVVGTTWTGNPNPSNALLANPANWDLAFAEPRLIPVVRLVVNTPYGGVKS